MKKRLFALLLAVVMAIALLPTSAMAAEGDVVAYAVEGGNIYFDPATGTITDADESITAANIPAEINGVAVTSIGDYAFSECKVLTSVTIPYGVTSIGDWAFYCYALNTVNIPDSVITIGEYAFTSTDITDVTIPSSVASIGAEAFSSSRLQNINVSEDNLNYSSIDGVLFNKEGTVLIKYPNGRVDDYIIPDGVTSIGDYAFAWCEHLTSVSIPYGVTSIGDWAFVCYALNTVNIPDSVVTIGAMAFHSTNITSVTIPGSVTSIGEGAFEYCHNLQSIDVAEDNLNYRSIDGVLLDKEGTVLIQYPGGKTGDYVIPDGVTFIDYAFNNCLQLTSVTIPSSVTGMHTMEFDCCHNLQHISVEADNKYYSSIDGVLFNKEGTELVKYPRGRIGTYVIPDGVTSIGTVAFDDCLNLTSVAFSNSVTGIGGAAFQGCRNLTSVSVPSSVTKIGSAAFNNCEKMTQIIIKNRSCAIDYDTDWHDHNLGTLGVVGTTVVYGYAGSTAEDYAKKYGYEFVALEEPIHEHTAKIQNAKDATCTTAGYTGDEVCTECGEVVKTGSTIPAKGHTWGAWISNKDATTEKDGTKTRTCSVCGEKETVTDTGSKLPAPTDPKPTDPTPSTPWKNPYSDVKSNAWYYDSVSFATQRGLFFGTSDTTFSPDGKMTRAMLVAVLYRLEGSPKASGNMPFTDVPTKEYYYDAVKWATANGIVYGTSADKFSPNANVTREQMVTFLYRYAKYKGIDVSSEASLSAFPDANRISNYAKAPFAWSVGADVIHGSDGKLLPGGTATRAEVATMLRFFVVNIVEK